MLINYFVFYNENMLHGIYMGFVWWKINLQYLFYMVASLHQMVCNYHVNESLAARKPK